MSRTYKCTNSSNKRINKNSRCILFWNWNNIRNQNIDYNDGSDKDIALKLRIGSKYSIYRKHSKYAKRHYRKQEKMNYKKNLNKGLNYNNWDELYLSATSKDFCRYT